MRINYVNVTPCHVINPLYFRFTTRVTAYNYLGSVVSDPVEVHVIEPLSAVLITVDGETVIGQQIKFEAYHFRGSDVMYKWEVGDGVVNVTTHAVIRHTYHR